MNSNGDEDDFLEATTDVVKQKILHVLKIYPKISPSMLQVGIGTALPPKIWRPVYEDMLKEGTIKLETVGSSSPSGRDQTYHIISLTDK